ncbi:Retrotransposon gag protein [Gossypium australe]|uniref:Retrotransposon gag protein n=1 Tax=Gossypium australe TaxID=47621 RepID=A0A5B6UVR5_9ROSI|nr:Retrotransposon gag protein [Gossypium australe]
MFYNGLDGHKRLRIDGATRGAVMNRTYDDAHEIIESISMNSCQWPTKCYTYGQKLRMRDTTDKSSSSASSIYGGNKPLCHYVNNPIKDVKYKGNRGGNPYSNTYNPRWRDHPNLRWDGNQGGGNNSNKVTNGNYQPTYL